MHIQVLEVCIPQMNAFMNYFYRDNELLSCAAEQLW